MKKIILFLAVVLFTTIANAQEYKEYYDNGNLKVIGNYDVNKKQTGVWKYYYENGQLGIVGH